MKKYLLTIFILFQIISLQAEESVVCLHGFFRSFRCMIPMANVLRDKGLHVYLWDYPGRKKTIEQHAEVLVGVLNAIAQKNPDEPIHFVSHSLGGLIVRSAVNHPQCPKEAKMGKAILLAPPNRGAIMARTLNDYAPMRWIFGNKAGLQLLTYDEEEMARLGDFPDSMDVLVIAGKRGGGLLDIWVKEPNDGKVTVEETRLNCPHRHLILDVGHSWIMTSRETIGIATDFLFNIGQDHAP